jgi:hypothetical protein
MANRTTSSSKRSRRSATQDPKGGLTAAGRRAFAREQGSHLRPGVRKHAAEMSATEMKRKGSWAVRFYGRKGKLPPLVDEHGEPTRFALTAHAWGEPVPKTVAAARAIARRGRALLARAEARAKDTTAVRRRAAKKRPSLVDNINARKRAGKSRPKSRSTVSRASYEAMEHGWGKKPA